MSFDAAKACPDVVYPDAYPRRGGGRPPAAESALRSGRTRPRRSPAPKKADNAGKWPQNLRIRTTAGDSDERNVAAVGEKFTSHRLEVPMTETSVRRAERDTKSGAMSSGAQV